MIIRPVKMKTTAEYPIGGYVNFIAFEERNLTLSSKFENTHTQKTT